MIEGLKTIDCFQMYTMLDAVFLSYGYDGPLPEFMTKVHIGHQPWPNM